MSIDELDKIIAECPSKIAETIGELHSRIREAAASVLEESQDTGKPAKLAIPIKLAIDLNHAPPAWSVSASVGVRFKSESEKVQSGEEAE